VRRNRAAIDAFRGTLALLVADDAEALATRITASLNPLVPQAAGGRALHHVAMDGTTVVRKTGDPLHLTFPPDPSERVVRVCLCGIAGRHVLRADPVSTPVFPVTDGAVTDDPNGPDLLRPDDRHGLILTDAHARPDDAFLLLKLSRDVETRTQVSSTPGLQLAYQKWDDRQNLLLFSSAHPEGSLLSLSLRDLKVRDARIPGFPHRVMALLPLYWFQANAHSAHHCLNVPERVDLIENGPECVRFRVLSHNPARTARSEVTVSIPYHQDRLLLDLTCRFTALERWDLPEIQYCNYFPEATRMPGAWNADRVLAVAGDGQRTLVDPRVQGDGRVRDGEPFRYFRGSLFVAHYGGPRGNVFALSRLHEAAGAGAGYQLCACWLDNHLSLRSPGSSIPAGTCYEARVSLGMAHTTNMDADIEEMARRSLARDALVL